MAGASLASTAAGPAFEGVNISCGSRAVDGAIVGVDLFTPDGPPSNIVHRTSYIEAPLHLRTVADQPPIGLTGSGLLELVYKLRLAEVIEPNGRLVSEHPVFGNRLSTSIDLRVASDLTSTGGVTPPVLPVAVRQF
jgi:uncharacterized 2Fe-2S/4Fe-4S cluster protein (DUF4445 family)